MSTQTIVSLLTEHTCQEERRTPILVTKSIIPTQIQLWLCTTCDGTILVLWICCGSTCTLTSFCIMLIVSGLTICIITSKLIGIESTQRLPFHNLLCPTISRNTCYTRITLCNCSRFILLISQAVHLVLVMRKIEGCLPCKVFILYRNGIDRKFYSIIGNLTHICRYRSVWINEGRNWIVPNQIIRHLIIKFDGTIQATIEKCKIKTNIEHTGLLPLQVLISQFCCLKSSPILAIDCRNRTIGTICCHC